MIYNIPVLTKLISLIVMADDHIDPKEVEIIKKIVQFDGLDITQFNKDLDALNDVDKDILFVECVTELKRKSYNTQVYFVALMFIIAYCDGSMTKTEWKILRDIYHHELNIPISEITMHTKSIRQGFSE